MSITRVSPSLRLVGAAILCVLGALSAIYVENLAAAEPFTAEGVTVKDGDTIHVRVLHLGWGVALTDQTIRAADFDAWESSRARRSVDVTDEEIVKGKHAAAALSRLVREHRLRIEPNIGQERDVYGRLLAIWYIADDEHKPLRPVAEFMHAGGHCRK